MIYKQTNQLSTSALFHASLHNSVIMQLQIVIIELADGLISLLLNTRKVTLTFLPVCIAECCAGGRPTEVGMKKLVKNTNNKHSDGGSFLVAQSFGSD